jgi:hypothetical protein
MLRFSGQSKTFQGKIINEFLSQVQASETNKLGAPLGQLFYNKNMSYLYSTQNVFLKTRHGSDLIQDINARSYGAGNYTYNNESDYFVWVDSIGDLVYLDEDDSIINIIKSGIGTSQAFFYMYGAQTSSALYGCNGTNVFKVTGAVPVYSDIASSPPATMIAFSNISKRMFAIRQNSHRIDFTEPQVDALNLTNLETWGTDNNVNISPDNGSGIKAIIDDGQIMYFIKDTGIWALPNAYDDPTDWIFPKLKSNIGTLSPKTVCRAKYGDREGIVFLASDKTLRFFSPQIRRNSGTLPDIISDDTIIISKNFQEVLDGIPDLLLSDCAASFFDNELKLTVATANASRLNYRLVIDMEKLVAPQGRSDSKQPRWYFDDDGLFITDYVIRSSNNMQYGFNIDGYISLLNAENLRVDEVPTRIDASGSVAIEWGFYLSWFKFSAYPVELQKLYVNYQTEGYWVFKCAVNSFSDGDPFVPDFDNASLFDLRPYQGGSFYDISQFDISQFSGSGQESSIITPNRKGQYFLFGIYGKNKGETASIFSLAPVFKTIRQSVITRR